MYAAAVLRPIAILLLLAGGAAVLALAAVLVRHVLGGVHAGLWLFAWSAGFAVLLPVLVTGAAMAAALARRVIVPNAVRAVPGAGQ